MIRVTILGRGGRSAAINIDHIRYVLDGDEEQDNGDGAEISDTDGGSSWHVTESPGKVVALIAVARARRNNVLSLVNTEEPTA